MVNWEIVEAALFMFKIMNETSVIFLNEGKRTHEINFTISK